VTVQCSALRGCLYCALETEVGTWPGACSNISTPMKPDQLGPLAEGYVGCVLSLILVALYAGLGFCEAPSANKVNTARAVHDVLSLVTTGDFPLPRPGPSRPGVAVSACHGDLKSSLACPHG
jgi:hypothetical protein